MDLRLKTASGCWERAGVSDDPAVQDGRPTEDNGSVRLTPVGLVVGSAPWAGTNDQTPQLFRPVAFILTLPAHNAAARVWDTDETDKLPYGSRDSNSEVQGFAQYLTVALNPGLKLVGHWGWLPHAD